MFSWHPEHVFGMFRALTDDDGSVILVIVCSPWQSVQTGDSAIPARIPFPCTLRSYWSRIPEWHFPHKVGMFWRWVAERGWSPGRIAWLPCQSGHTAEPRRPDLRDAIPWTPCSYASMTCWPGSLYFSSIARSLWHLRHTATMFSLKVRDLGSFDFRMSCLPWQSAHPATSVAPLARSLPWVLPAYDFAASAWHLAHDTCASLPWEAFASAWHVVHVPFPWIESRYAFSSTNRDSVLPSGSVVSIVESPWQS